MSRFKYKKIKKSKKYTSIEVEENEIINQELNDNNKDNIIKEVKEKKYNMPCSIEKTILYDGKKFVKDRHQNNDYPKIINYRCIYYRKNESKRQSLFCNALVKRKEGKNFVYFILDKQHSKECDSLSTVKKKEDTNLIGNYNDFINKCFKYLDSTEFYNKKEFTINLQNIYNENKYNFRLKENTIKNIIGRWKSNSLRFTKYNAIENRFNKNNELILWEYNNSPIFTSNKKNPYPSEYFIWSTNQIIARERLSKHIFIDATFHHPIEYQQLLIIIFKDIITSEYYPGFFILMSNKTEILYDMVFKSIKNILTQNNIYELKIETITTDTEIALINAIHTNFPKSQRIGCWLHLKQDLMREAKKLGLFNSKNKKVNPDMTLEVITQLSLLPLEYKGDINYLKNKLDLFSKQYPLYSNMIKGYFYDNKIKYFEDNSYNYNIFPKDIRSNSILERYNKTIKSELGEKRTCNWVVFLNFINRELERINTNLSKNENINVLYQMKYTKFGIEKYANKNNNNIIQEKIYETITIKTDISEAWLIQKGNNCRYNAFITLLYFTITPYINSINDINLKMLNDLNQLILELANNINNKNYNKIIIFLQKNKFDSNNLKIDEIINETDEEKKMLLIENLNIVDSIDFSSSGYAAQLFSIFNNNPLFCLKENKETECIICGTKKTEEIREMRPFIYINNTNINQSSIFNLLLENYKEKYSYACDCRKNLPGSEDVLCVKIKYNLLNYPIFLFLLFDFQFTELETYKSQIYKLVEDKLILNFKAEYKLVGIIAAPCINHYNTIIFNPVGTTINSKFIPTNIYWHDGIKNEGKIVEIKKGEDWREKGIPYIVLYKKLDI